jgi:hypothetical protein
MTPRRLLRAVSHTALQRIIGLSADRTEDLVRLMRVDQWSPSFVRTADPRS